MADDDVLALIDAPRAEGSPDGPLVVLVHGALDRATSFRLVIRHLHDLDVVAVDRRGYARSRHLPVAISLADHVADLFRIIADRPCVIVGHSYGGDVAIAAACERPAQVRAVGAFEPPMPWLPWWPETSAGSQAMSRSRDASTVAEVFMIRMIGERRWGSLPERTKEERRSEGEALLSDLRSIRRDPPFDVTAVPVPVVLGCGTESLPHQIANVRRVFEELPDVELVEIEGGRHGSHASKPLEFSHFVRRVVARAATL
ncbi:MAG TPA: alpha/beta hydrolase [Acidimicrobiales bacterium]|nr:alpha/beta hydrolase [Acidimicrobiales bacterium]